MHRRWPARSSTPRPPRHREAPHRWPPSRRELLRERRRAWRGIDQQRVHAIRLHQPRRRERVVLGTPAARRSVSRDVGTAVCQEHRCRGLTPPLQVVGEGTGGVNARRQRRPAPSGQSCEAALGPYQRARRRQQQLGRRATKRDECHAVAPHVAVGQQVFHRALGLGEPVERGRARRVDDKDGGRLGALPEARDVKVLAADIDARGAAFGRGRGPLAPPNGLPRHRRAQRVDDAQPRPRAKLAATRADGPSPARRQAEHAGMSAKTSDARATD